MFRWLQRRPNRGVVLAKGKDDLYRWRVVRIPKSMRGDSVIEDALRTCFLDTAADGYPGTKGAFRDAKREITEWVDPSRITWWLEQPKGVYLKCRYLGDTLELPEGLS